MKKTKEMEKKMSVKNIDLLRIIKDEYIEFQKSTDSDERMDHMMEVLFGTFLYLLTRYDYGNFMKLKETKEDSNNE